MLLATHDYLGSIEYKGSELEAIYHDEGRVYYEEGTGRYEFNIRDHLGNTRLTFTDKDNDDIIEVSSNPATNEILQENHYYPFGMNMNGQWMANAGREDKYQYNGKELNEDFGLNWYDYGARWYMPDIGRWGQVDPLAEKYYPHSPYNYTLNNPIKFIDPDGTHVEPIVSTNDNGKTTITFKVTGKVVNLSNNPFASVNNVAKEINKRGIRMSGGTIDVTGLGVKDASGNEINGEAIIDFDF
ncbi:MAG: RHS repeat-associated core domain-containing protein [Saprospiraceae bacterium]|nr:RHS repeat-associated core domain-containing protein [Saprospiraceae bacterium]